MGFIKNEERKYKGSMGDTSGVLWQRERAFLFQVLLEPTLTHGEDRARRFPSNNE
jgi:hypothetical protein